MCMVLPKGFKYITHTLCSYPEASTGVLIDLEELLSFLS